MCPGRLISCFPLVLSVLFLIYSVCAITTHQDSTILETSKSRIHDTYPLDLSGSNNINVEDIINSRPQVRCEWVKVPMCLGVGYNYTTMPNGMGHHTQRDVLEGLQQYSHLLDHQCSPFLRLYICSVFVPFCSEHIGAVPPCRTLCETVKSDCLPALQEIAEVLSWPEQLNCSRLPDPPGSLCMTPPKDGGLEATDIRIKHPGVRLPPLIPPIGYQPPLIEIVPCPTNTIATGDDCLTICGSQSPEYTAKDRFKAEIWIALWSIVTLIFSIFSLLTFVLQPKRFRWPARPILYLTSCGAASNSVALLRWIVGPYTCSGDSMVLNQSYDSCICIGSALIITYFQMAYANWWLIFAYVWYLSAAREWSTEAIERISTRLHHYVWTSSLLPIIYILLANAISFNTITGTCQLDSKLLTAVAAVIVSIGAVLSILTARALHRVKLTLLYSGSRPYKLNRLIYRLCIISFGICVCLYLALGARHLRSTNNNPHENGTHKSNNQLSAELIRIGGFCASACFASLWVVSAKTFRTWNKALTCKKSGGCASWLIENKQGQQGQQGQQQRSSLRLQMLIGGSTKV